MLSKLLKRKNSLHLVLIMPFVFLLMFGSFWLTYKYTQGLELASLIGMLFLFAFVFVFEKIYPRKNTWKIDRQTLKNDIGLLIVSDGIGHAVISWLIAIIVVQQSRPSVINVLWWPEGLYPIVHILLALLLASFLQYWQHRLSHQIHYLWRLHSVHHSSNKMQLTAVFRFHPLDIILEQMVAIIPLYLLGAPDYAIVSYIMLHTFFAVMTHSNLEQNYGFLRYVFVAPATHHIHHSTKPNDFNTNYGNLLIIWDIIFGTARIPNDYQTNEVGLNNANYPTTMLGLLLEPFRIASLEPVIKKRR